MKAISCRVDPFLHRQVMKLAEASGDSAANIVRKAIAHGFAAVEADLRPQIERRRQLLRR